jgi:hypothetical protein
MKSSKKNKGSHSPKSARTYPGGGLQEQEIPASPGKASSKSGFFSRFLPSKSIPQETQPIPIAVKGRVTPDLPESRESSEKQKSRDNSPKSITIGLASSTYRNLSQSWTDLAALTSRSKPSSPDIESVLPPLSPHSIHAESPPSAKPILLPFQPESVQRQGWLNKRPDSDLKRSKSGVPATWKLQRAIVHDSRLYLYNPPSSLGIRAFSPSPAQDPSQAPSLQPSLTHVKHAHSPSEGVSGQASLGQLALEDLARRPSTAPQTIATGNLINEIVITWLDVIEKIPTASTQEPTLGLLRLDEEQEIVGGTVTGICHHILSTPPQATGMDDDGRIFCMTVGFWAPVEVVLNEMTRIAARRDVLLRVDQIIRFWCDNTPRILWEDGANEALLTLVEEGVTRIDVEKGRSLSNYIVEAEKKFKDLLHPFSDATIDSLQSTLIIDKSYI